MRTYLIIFLSLFFFTNSGKSVPSGQLSLSSYLPEVNYRDVSYGNDPKQKIDIYLPAGRSKSKTNVLVLIHGGGWTQGDKADFKDVLDSLKNRLPDYAIFNINYRLANRDGNFFPTQEEDIKAAIDFIFRKRKEYKISSRWVLAGASAGAHLALLQGYKYSKPVKPKAIINYSEPTDLDSLIANTDAKEKNKAELKIITNKVVNSSSPARLVNVHTPPTISFQGLNDGLVPPSQQIYLHSKLKAMNIPEKLELYPNEGHGFTPATMTRSMDAIVDFLKKYVK